MLQDRTDYLLLTRDTFPLELEVPNLLDITFGVAQLTCNKFLCLAAHRFGDKSLFHLTRETEISQVDHMAWGRLAESMRMIAGRDEAARSIFHKAVELVQADLEINENKWGNHGFLAVYLGYLGEFQRAHEPALEPIWGKYPDRMHDLLNRH